MKSTLPKSEADVVEFKCELSDTFEKGVVAFLNHEGGTIYIGIPRILKKYSKDVIQITESHLRVVLPYAEGYVVPAISGERIGDTVNDTVNDTLRLILEILRAHPESTYVDLAKAIGKSRATLARHMKDLVDRRVILRIGPAKGGRWEVLP